MCKYFNTYTDRKWTAEEMGNARKVCKMNANVADVPTETLMAALEVANRDMTCEWMCAKTEAAYKKVEARIRGWYEPTARELAARMA